MHTRSYTVSKGLSEDADSEMRQVQNTDYCSSDLTPDTGQLVRIETDADFRRFSSITGNLPKVHFLGAGAVGVRPCLRFTAGRSLIAPSMISSSDRGTHAQTHRSIVPASQRQPNSKRLLHDYPLHDCTTARAILLESSKSPF